MGFIKKNLVKIRAVTSTLLLVISVVVTFTGVGLFLAPSGRIARETGWTFFGFEKIQLEKLHTLTGFIMVGLIVFHFIINYSMYANEMKILLRRKKNK